jgi:hypothetical protein
MLYAFDLLHLDGNDLRGGAARTEASCGRMVGSSNAKPAGAGVGSGEAARLGFGMPMTCWRGSA